MLTIEVKLNGRVIAQAKLVNQTNLSDVRDYALTWFEEASEGILIPEDAGRTLIRSHNRRQTAWALVAKAAAAILGQKVERMEGKG